MGLFSWLKKTGANASNAAGDAANSAKNAAANANDSANAAFEAKLAHQKKVMLTGLVDSLGLDIQNFDLDYKDGQVAVYGQVSSDKVKSMVISTLQNADGIRFVDNRISVTAPAAPAVQSYTVKSGDSLSKIAKEFYGDPMKYKEIFAANTDVLEDPNKIFPGQELKIPTL